MIAFPRLAFPSTRNSVILFFGVLVPLFCFGVMAEDVLDQKLLAFDRPVLVFLHAHATDTLNRIMVWSSRAGSALVLVPVVITVAIYLYRQRVQARTWFWVLSVCGAALLNFLAKYSFARARPSLWVSILPETTYSFPSGHAMESMAVATAIVFLVWNRGNWRWASLAFGSIFVLLVGASRIYLGVHYPSDVLAGWLASLAWVVGLVMIKKPWQEDIQRDAINSARQSSRQR
jgi:membrane-associated phospholipid phosphatase